jgi:alkyl hydroperoxide reductase subunit F
MENNLYDLIIIGGGPAGSAASVYAARKRLKTLVITGEFGGQSTVSVEIQNWIGTIAISGTKLATDLRDHVKAYASDILEIREGELATSVSKDGEMVILTTDAGTYRAKSLLIATGSHHRKLEVPGADKLEHKGLTYCASCDGPLFSDMDVVVVGGGNAAFETAAQLLAYCTSVTLIHRSDTFRADPVTVDKLCCDPKMHVIKNADILEVKGDKMVSSIVYKNKLTGEIIDLPTSGIFVEVGQLPNTSYVKNIVAMTEYNQIIIDPRTQKTNTPGIWAAGDCTDVLYHQNNIAAGDAVRALEDIYQTLKSR